LAPVREERRVLFIEYDVHEDGEIELVALINATEEDGEDADGEAWLSWRRTHEDGGMGCAAVSPEDLRRLEETEETEQLRAIVEQIILADRAGKETVA
jgi:uncharacterized protein YrzB (UPF0473 family)